MLSQLKKKKKKRSEKNEVKNLLSSQGLLPCREESGRIEYIDLGHSLAQVTLYQHVLTMQECYPIYKRYYHL